jgi:hypothetical protein
MEQFSPTVQTVLNKNGKSRGFSFTLNNPTEEDYVFLNGIGNSEGVSQLIYQLEEGEKRLTPHLQGFIYFNTTRHLSAVIQLLRRCHIEVAKRIFALKQYCMKEKTRIGPNFHFKNGKTVDSSLKLSIGKFVLKKEDLYPWQAKVEEIFLSEPDNRSIYYFYEVEGNTGKSSLISYLYHHYEDCVFSTSGRPMDIKHGFTNRIQTVGPESIRAVIWDIPRLLIDRTNKISKEVFLTAEQFKNGHFFTSKYESKEVRFAVPHVFIFSNIVPTKILIESLSRDRWKIFRIDNEQLFLELSIE